jgi:hypothetical protein
LSDPVRRQGPLCFPATLYPGFGDVGVRQGRPDMEFRDG